MTREAAVGRLKAKLSAAGSSKNAVAAAGSFALTRLNAACTFQHSNVVQSDMAGNVSTGAYSKPQVVATRLAGCLMLTACAHTYTHVCTSPARR
jgi:hypothetical protein